MNINAIKNYHQEEQSEHIEKIYQTRNYEQFRRIPSNRKLYRKHVDYLKSLIQENNRLSEFPLAVTKKMEVIDGQHRLQAAKELNLPVYFKIGNNLKEEDIITFNSVAKIWSCEDYLNYYCNKEKPAYLELKKIIYKYHLTIGMTVRLLSYGSTNDSMLHFRNGTLRLKNLDIFDETMQKVLVIIQFLNEKMDPKFKQFIRTTKFRTAIFNFMANEDVDIDVFLKKLSMKIPSFIQCGTIQQYYEMFEKIYNYKNPNPIQFVQNKEDI